MNGVRLIEEILLTIPGPAEAIQMIGMSVTEAPGTIIITEVVNMDSMTTMIATGPGVTAITGMRIIRVTKVNGTITLPVRGST